MRPKLFVVTALVGSFLGISPLYAPAQTYEATVGVSGESYNVNGNKAKLFEYSDKHTSKALGSGEARYDSPSYFLGLTVQDPGYDTQQYRLDGGAYGKFKYWADYNEIIHNRTFDARTFYFGAGTESLVGTANPNPATWPAPFDYDTKRKRFGTGLDFSIPKPFFFNVSYMHEDKDGTMPVGVSTGNSGTFFGSPGSASLELPVPINYTNDGFTAEAGYALKPFFLSVNYSQNEFRNGSETIFFTPVGNASGILSQPPDNKFYRFGIKGSADLPMNSKFSLNIGEGRTTSDVSGLGFGQYDGEVDTHNYDFQLASRPLTFLDAKVFYRYYGRDNKSSGVIPAGNELLNIVPLSYQTNTYGVETGIQLPVKLYLNGGYKYVDTDRRIENLTDPALALPHNKDNVYSVDLRWRGSNVITPWIGYEYLERDADYRNFLSATALTKQFAYAAQDRNTFKAGADFSPLEALNTSLEYQYKKSDYRDTAFGYTADTRYAFSMSADYTLKKLARFSGYFDFENVKYQQRGIVSGSVWESDQGGPTYGYGFRSDVYVIPKKLTFILQYDCVQANGSNDFTFYDNGIWSAIGVPAGSPVNIPNWDDYRKYSARFAAVYQWSERLSTKLGYAYERYKYSDAQINGYQFFVDGAASNQAYLTGAYSSPSYSANLVFLSMTYRFK